MDMATATFAAGCFWGVESVFEQVDGVTSTRVGYTGGRTDQPTYRDVCSHRTGHAEAVELDYDPSRVTYDRLLDIFWSNHDPTQLNRQGPDVGDQYRSAIFVHDAEQERVARDSLQRLESSGRFRRPIVTQIIPAGTFWEAEEYHQKYFSRRGLAATCHL
jgi:peptide-methionine (S)-S-oxide reductase